MDVRTDRPEEGKEFLRDQGDGIPDQWGAGVGLAMLIFNPFKHLIKTPKELYNGRWSTYQTPLEYY